MAAFVVEHSHRDFPKRRALHRQLTAGTQLAPIGLPSRWRSEPRRSRNIYVNVEDHAGRDAHDAARGRRRRRGGADRADAAAAAAAHDRAAERERALHHRRHALPESGQFPVSRTSSRRGTISDYNENSPTYTISDFPFLSFAVAIDVNTAKGEERLLEFHAFVDADGLGGPGGFEEIYFFAGPSDIADPLPSNGNGYGDWTLEAIDLSALRERCPSVLQRRLGRGE